MTENVLVIGAGMAGLWTALALAPTGRQVVVLERDPPPPEGGADAAFQDWTRRGVGHLRHSHAFLARLRILIRDEHPQLLEELLEAGCRDLGFEGGLTDIHKRSYTPDPDVAQTYVRDPAGNLLEIDTPGASRLPEWLRARMRKLDDIYPQDEVNRRARLYVKDPAAY